MHEVDPSHDARHKPVKVSEYSAADEDVPLKQGIFLSPHNLPEEEEDTRDSSHRGSPPPSRRSSGVGSGSKQNPNRPSHSSSSHSGSSKQGSIVTLPKEGSMTNMEKVGTLKPPPPQQQQVKWYHVWSAKIVNNKYVVAFMMLLTVYALTGDDFRLLATNKPDDVVFNILTILCLFFFSLEVVLSCLGKDDYFPGFFFCLDFISTLTLVMDLTWVAEYLVGDEDDFDRARSGRTARMGAKVGRIVRVIRLIRIVKLYKAYYDSRSKKQKRRRIDPVTGEEIVGGEPGEDDEDDWGDDDGDATKTNPQQKESHVGKQLSALTTRRVIILVLSMLLGLPLLGTDSSQMTPASPAYGADDVYEAFLAMEKANNELWQQVYEKTMLRYIYYHNWYNRERGECQKAGKSQGCSNSYYSNVFWIGIASKNETLRKEKAIAAQLRAQTVSSWELNVSSHDYAYNYGTMPGDVVPILSSQWRWECTVSKLSNRGLSLLEKYDGFKVTCPDDLRVMERSKWNPRLLSLDDYQTWHFAFYFDLRPYIKAESAFSICVTCFVCLVLCVASVLFSKDASELVLDPVETMIAKVNMIRENPLIAMKMADNEFKVEEMNKAKQAKMNKERLLTMLKNIVFCRETNSEVMETAILDRTIIKLGTLLALGFGEAGANIVSHNISNSAGVNAMIEGTKIDCILGSTRIENFSTATEVLQGKVMTFVNQIAEIVHGVIDEFGGAANRNNGETFLLIWRLGKNLEAEEAARTSDMAVVGFAKVLGVVHRSIVLASYRGHPGLQQRLGQNNRVNLMFGLHQGWAIEGAVGTEFKIDASYLSPHVSITESVLQATTVYGVPLVVSQAVVSNCTKAIASKCRLFDKVKIRGSTSPMCLYSLDLDYMSLHVDEPKTRNYVWNPRQRFRARQLLEAEKNRKRSAEVSISAIFDESPDVVIMRRRYTMEFLQLFNMGYQNYYEGEWAVARRLLSHTRDLLGISDGPSIALLRFMETPFQFQAPRGWQGVHEFGGGDVDTVEHPEPLAAQKFVVSSSQ